jgi:isoleucyl-tRNA synthetase
LHECLEVVTLLMAPMTPFVTERVWQDVFAASSQELPESVHLASWPQADTRLVEPDLGPQMKLARRLVELGRAARAEAKVRTRQPLGRALVATGAYDRLSEELRREVADELNVGSIEPLSSAGADLVDHSAKGNFRALGKRFAKDTPRVAGAIAAADASALAASLASDGRATVDLDGSPVEVLVDVVILSERPREGWSVVNEQGETVALDLEVTPELRRAGLAREVVRMVQEARKSAGFEVSDRIELRWHAEGQTAEALVENGDFVASEVLATAGLEQVTDPERASALGDEGGSTVQDTTIGLVVGIRQLPR